MSALENVGKIIVASLEIWAKEVTEASKKFEDTLYGRGYADGIRDATQIHEGDQ